MNVSQYTIQHLSIVSLMWVGQTSTAVKDVNLPANASPKRTFDVLQPVRQRLESLKIENPQLAHRLCRLIPAQCPFERDVKFLGRTLFHIPPMCKLNPLYEEVVGLRFRALCYLADECGEDISSYC